MCCECCSILLLYCFSASVVNLYLHSFPTRRSSDLTAPKAATAATASAGTRPRATRADMRAALILALAMGACASDGSGEDRKSTRLNSSHLVISYAVFCLKKKENVTA